MAAHQRFQSRFAYMIPDCECFEDLVFEHAATRVLMAERYGGEGVADNGGGVRCGNIDAFQVKGIGKNPLAGAGHDPLHSYGGLSAIDAIYETIYANTIDKILPLGVANIHGLLLTGPNAALNLGHVAGERGWGALIVRDVALRPAHFVRAGHFVPAPAFRPYMSSDVARVRRINRQFAKQFTDTRDYIRFIGQFLGKCANQFAFARFARLTHGSLGVGNICFDGRWIDLTNTGFIRSDQNTGGFLSHLPSFYDELLTPIKIVQENIDTFNKYNRTNLGVAPLAAYYEQQLDVYFSLHVGYILGIRSEELDNSKLEKPLEIVKNIIFGILSSGVMVRNSWPLSLSPTDPILCFIENVFLSLFDRDAGYEALKNNINTADIKIGSLIESIVMIFNFKLSIGKCAAKKKNLCLLAIFFTAHKRACLPEYFFKERMERTTRAVLATNDISKIRTYVVESIDLSKWIFDDTNNNSVVLLKIPQAEIIFDVQIGYYIVSDTITGNKKILQSARAMLSYVENSIKELWVLHDFDFQLHLKRALVCAVKFEESLQKP